MRRAIRIRNILVMTILALLTTAVSPLWGDKQTVILERKLIDDPAWLASLGLDPDPCGFLYYRTGDYHNSSWPSLKSRKPLHGDFVPASMAMYGRGFSQGDGLPVAADKSGGDKGIYDILYIDLDGDGSISVNERFRGKPSGRMLYGRNAVDFGIIDLPQEYADRETVSVHLWLCVDDRGPHTDDYGQPAEVEALLFGSLAYCLEGQLDIGGARQALRVFDIDQDGRLCEEGDDYVALGDGPLTPIGKVVTSAGKAYSTEALDSSTLGIGAYTDNVGRVRYIRPPTAIPVTIRDVIEDAEGAAIVVVDKAGEGCDLPPGSYMLMRRRVIAEAGGDTWTNNIRGGVTIMIETGKDTILSLDQPFRLEVEPTGSLRPGSDITIKCGLYLQSGEQCYISKGADANYDSQKSVSVHAVIRDSSGRKLEGGDFILDEYVWTIPKSAKAGDRYTIEANIDTGPFAGVVSGSCTVTLDPNDSVTDVSLPLAPGAISLQDVPLVYKLCRDEADRYHIFRGSYGGAIAEEPIGDDGTIAWPPANCDEPFHGTIRLGGTEVEPLAAAFMLDTSDKQRHYYDVLYVDLNLDGKFDPSERIKGIRHTSEGPTNRVQFGIVSFPSLGEQQLPAAFMVEVTLETDPGPRGEQNPLEVSSSTYDYLEGQIAIAGGTVPVRVYDRAENGRVGQSGESHVVIGDDEPEILGQPMYYRGIWLTASVSGDGHTLTIGPAAAQTCAAKFSVGRNEGGVRSMYVMTDDPQGEIMHFHPCDGWPIQVPVAYSGMANGQIRIAQRRHEMILGFANLPLKLKAGKQTVVTLGKPLKATIAMEGRPAPAETVHISLVLRGAAGETYDYVHASGIWPERSEAQSMPPTVTMNVVVKDASGKTLFRQAGEWGSPIAWTVPRAAKRGAKYTIDASVDTLMFAGVVKATKKIVVGKR